MVCSRSFFQENNRQNGAVRHWGSTSHISKPEHSMLTRCPYNTSNWIDALLFLTE